MPASLKGVETAPKLKEFCICDGCARSTPNCVVSECVELHSHDRTALYATDGDGHSSACTAVETRRGTIAARIDAKRGAGTAREPRPFTLPLDKAALHSVWGGISGQTDMDSQQVSVCHRNTDTACRQREFGSQDLLRLFGQLLFFISGVGMDCADHVPRGLSGIAGT